MSGAKSIPGAADYLDCSTDLIRAHIASGELRPANIGTGTQRAKMVIPISQLDELIRRRTKPAPAKTTRRTRKHQFKHVKVKP